MKPAAPPLDASNRYVKRPATRRRIAARVVCVVVLLPSIVIGLVLGAMAGGLLIGSMAGWDLFCWTFGRARSLRRRSA